MITQSKILKKKERNCLSCRDETETCSIFHIKFNLRRLSTAHCRLRIAEIYFYLSSRDDGGRSERTGTAEMEWYPLQHGLLLLRRPTRLCFPSVLPGEIFRWVVTGGFLGLMGVVLCSAVWLVSCDRGP